MPEDEDPPRRDLLTLIEVCAELQITDQALYSMRYAGTAPPAIKVGRQLRFRRKDLNAWIDAQTASPSSH